MKRRRVSIVLLLATLSLSTTGCRYLVRGSTGYDGVQASLESGQIALSGNGRYLAFTSISTQLVRIDNNGGPDVFVRDLRDKTTEMASISSSEKQAGLGNVAVGWPDISSDGRYVAFAFGAGGLVLGDTNGAVDIYVRDRLDGITELVSLASGGALANGGSRDPAVSANGRYVAFNSTATNLVANDTNNSVDVFVRDRVAKTTTRVSVATGGAEAHGSSAATDLDAPPLAISDDGNVVAFASTAPDLVTGDTNGVADVFVHDRAGATTARASVASGGTEANRPSDDPSLSEDGRYVAFRSDASNLDPADASMNSDLFVRDRTLSITTAQTRGTSPVGDGGADRGAISADGRWLAFRSAATNFDPGGGAINESIFVKDVVGSGFVERVDTPQTGGLADSWSGPQVTISADGHYVAYQSDARNLVTPDTNDAIDVFVSYSQEPMIDSLTPGALARGTNHATVQVHGHAFTDLSRAALGAGVTVHSIVSAAADVLTLDVSVAAAATPGARTVVVVNVGTGAGGAAGTCGGCFTVT